MVRSKLTPVVIAGPTASGKSSLAFELAKRHKGEIICADSRQFFDRMDIGTACPGPDELRAITHHGYKLLDPATQRIHAGFFIRFAQKTIRDVQARFMRPIIVGGTGLYLRALRYGLSDVPPSDAGVARNLQERLDRLGALALHHELQRIDPSTAKLIDPHDQYRILRALEIYHITKQPPSALRKSFVNQKPKLHAIWLYKKPDRALLRSRIHSRVQQMFAQGLVEEALALRAYLPADHWALKVMGYEEALMYADGQMKKDQAVERVSIRHRQYAKRQYTWFNKEHFYKIIS